MNDHVTVSLSTHSFHWGRRHGFLSAGGEEWDVRRGFRLQKSAGTAALLYIIQQFHMQVSRVYFRRGTPRESLSPKISMFLSSDGDWDLDLELCPDIKKIRVERCNVCSPVNPHIGLHFTDCWGHLCSLHYDYDVLISELVAEAGERRSCWRVYFTRSITDFANRLFICLHEQPMNGLKE